VRGERLLVCKPLPTSLGLALLSGFPAQRMLLDVDDWEVGLSLPHDGSSPHPLRRAASALYGAARRGQPNSVLGTWLCERQARRVPARLVSNKWLQRRFGGTLLYHVRDEHFLDPARVSAEPLRARLGLDGRTWVGFVGTVRPHKGLRDLVAALVRLRGERAPGLLLLGTDPDDPVVAELIDLAANVLGPDRLRVRRQFDHAELPEHVAAADIVAVPSRDMPQSRGQVPAKVFDAMAMARPVVASRLNDLPEILDGCGVTVPPGDPAALARAIADLEEPARRRELGEAGRKKLVEHYSFSRGRSVLRDFVLGATA